jgi:hypothetical protein
MSESRKYNVGFFLSLVRFGTLDKGGKIGPGVNKEYKNKINARPLGGKHDPLVACSQVALTQTHVPFFFDVLPDMRLSFFLVRFLFLGVSWHAE